MEDQTQLLEGKTIGFIGAGNMAEAIIKGLVSRGVVSPQRLVAADVLAERRAYIADTYRVAVEEDNRLLVEKADILILAVKPQVTVPVLQFAGAAMGPDKLLVSIVAGVPVAAIAALVAAGTRIIRTIPNTPLMVMAGAVAIAADSPALPADFALARRIFDACGRTVMIEEKLMDAATGLSGSGPAYVFLMIEALADGGVKAGLTREVALTLAAQTLLGAARMCLTSGRHPGQLKDMVTSPGGTTIAGIHALEVGGLRAALMNAVEAATRRSQELGKLP
ncbi:MAG TPA: pyrroline-5-carboxylate reductase [Desulfobacterales bacterium]|nr:pyrroline-5-carboxylate reductase [Desulfobacterales bacterium]